MNRRELPSRRPLALFTLAVLVPVLGANNCKTKTGEEIDPLAREIRGNAASVDTALQVVSLRPAAVDPDKAFTVSVFGAGFEDGAIVLLGDDILGSVTWESENSLSWQVPAQPGGVYDVTVRNPKMEESTLFGALSVRDTSRDCWEVHIFFGLNAAGLSADAKQILDAKLDCYRGSRGKLLVEGHADERGTTDHNLALGQRRAEAVRRHLVRGGLSRTRTRTVTYGEERPIDRAHNEDAWAQNRRAEVRLRD